MSALVSPSYQQQDAHNSYYSQQSPAASSGAAHSPSASARKTARRPSGNNGIAPETPQQSTTQQFSPSSNVTTPRAYPLPPSTNNTPAASPAVANTYSPRGSSQQRGPATTAARQEHMAGRGDDRSASSRVGHTQLAERIRPDAGAAGSGHPTRRAHDGSHDYAQQQPSSSRKQVPQHSRSANAVGNSPAGTSLPREDSTVLNRIVVTDPKEDYAREQARLQESIPQPVGGAKGAPVQGIAIVGNDGTDEARPAPRSRQDHSQSKHRKETKFGEYVLGQTLGEGEFGKVKMGWKRDSGVQVAIKLIRRETLGSNPSRLPKIYREISILRGLQHPNIVRLHEMVETERHIGIILEYASGGELFDYILNHRYLKDNAARRLFAQLVSGVGYLHKMGIVHRDLKLENLLLDRNKNIIITDFGFANTFSPNDELGEDLEGRLNEKDFVKNKGLDKVGADGHRRGDLMQTSCGSPCYAAPELVVSDSLYTGRKVDVWSCGVILYAMLAGYLPFDDDPANPEGDNINLLYKYIVSTPLTFPEYVTPHARDLLKRILVPDPRKRADLFEVARHSWLAEYAQVVASITSSTTTPKDIANTTVTSGDDPFDVPLLNRSASVREPAKAHVPSMPAANSYARKGGYVPESVDDKTRAERENKRRTVQLEYVPPASSTVRDGSSVATGGSRTRRSEAQEVPATDGYQSSSARQQHAAAPSNTQSSASRPTRETQRAVPDSTAFANPQGSSSRPSTANALGGSRLPSRGNSYGQPVAATVAQTNAQGHLSQPRGGKQYVISNPMPYQPQASQEESIGRPSIQGPAQGYQQSAQPPQKGHRRSNTVGGLTEKIFGKSGSGLFSRSGEPRPEKPEKSYPPTSMKQPIPNNDDITPRQSTESSRRTSFGFSRKNSADPANGQRASRRFSLIPSFKGLGSSKETQATYNSDPRRSSAQPPPKSSGRNSYRQVMAFGQGAPRSPSQSTTGSTGPGFLDGARERQQQQRRPAPSSVHGPSDNYVSHQGGYSENNLHNITNKEISINEPHPTERHHARQPSRHQQQQHQQYSNQDSNALPRGSSAPVLTQPSSSYSQQQQQYQQRPYANENVPDSEEYSPQPHSKLHKPNRKFGDAYEEQSGHAGSSGAAKRVMDFFRKRGRARGGD